MFTTESLKQANEDIKTIPIHGKQYAQVPERVKGFRKICPSGFISTEIISMENGVVTMKATVYDEKGNPIATGFAQEKDGSSTINKTSYIENCETSAIGRALGFAGIGSECSMASAEEVTNAILQQNDIEYREQSIITAKEQQIIENLCAKKGIKVEEMFNIPLCKLNGDQFARALTTITAYPDKS